VFSNNEAETVYLIQVFIEIAVLSSF